MAVAAGLADAARAVGATVALVDASAWPPAEGGRRESVRDQAEEAYRPESAGADRTEDAVPHDESVRKTTAPGDAIRGARSGVVGRGRSTAGMDRREHLPTAGDARAVADFNRRRTSGRATPRRASATTRLGCIDRLASATHCARRLHARSPGRARRRSSGGGGRWRALQRASPGRPVLVHTTLSPRGVPVHWTAGGAAHGRTRAVQQHRVVDHARRSALAGAGGIGSSISARGESGAARRGRRTAPGGGAGTPVVRLARGHRTGRAAHATHSRSLPAAPRPCAPILPQSRRAGGRCGARGAPVGWSGREPRPGRRRVAVSAGHCRLAQRARCRRGGAAGRVSNRTPAAERPHAGVAARHSQLVCLAFGGGHAAGASRGCGALAGHASGDALDATTTPFRTDGHRRQMKERA
eukprot:ctg_13.g7